MNKFHYIGNELELFSNAQKWKHYFTSIIGPYIGKRTIEVGAGIGETTAILCDGSQEIWLCIEPDEKLRKQIDDKVSSGELPSCCQTSGKVIREFENGQQFDTIIFIDVLEHISDDFAELLAASQQLVPGGFLIVLAPAHQALFSEFDRSIGHLRRYNKTMLSSLTPPTCQVERSLYLDSVGILTSLANLLILKQSLPKEKQILFWDRCLVPISRLLDRLISYRIGRSIVFIWKGYSN